MEKVFYEERDRCFCCSDIQMRVAVLGATGSVGKAVMDIVRLFPNFLIPVVLVGGSNVDLMQKLFMEFRPKRVGMFFEPAAEDLEKRLGVNVYSGDSALLDIWKYYDDIDAIVVCVSGIHGFKPIYEAVKLGKRVFFSTKEALVVGGGFIITELKSKEQLIPLDSEHWAILSCLDLRGEVKRIFLTASGGALRDRSHEERRRASPLEVLEHPVWNMGKKITVDSATLMNKGFEVIEAYHLFGLSLDSIKVLIHREGYVHGMVEFLDGSVKALLFYPDMRIVVQEALLHPLILENPALPKIEFNGKVNLSFEEPDFEEYPCLSYAYYAARVGGNLPVILNAADEVAVSLFLSYRLKFSDIPKFIRKVLFYFPREDLDSPEDIFFWDREARKFAEEVSRNC
ncbi:MAG: 1-deoxy-D-xylulose-5-phosphate reductoisomerase [Synergistetes bacterium]|nr:1-deoxy-D-xylulose-5-phosphate reductoisomerase [Synergistota bacterium]MCX8127940.1 1-deoxy-D-xylulose-5-phosphate reductoisomerase [Synergistota bacterium]MDW8192019.1 1-deoxy-D-xylulose-5-phosphate reductoisomerase [Synergistota bacterium]